MHKRYRQSSASLLLMLGACASAPPPAPPAIARPNQPPNTVKELVLDQPLYIKDVGFDTPESVLYDQRADMYLVSNIEGSPLAKDDSAFIARVRPDGKLDTLRWIDSRRPEIELNAPKGMAIVGDVLYVADIAAIRKFDRKSGKPLGSIDVPGATFINDLCSDARGNVYATDSGIANGFKPSGSDAVFRLGKDGKLEVLARDVGLGRPNGLSADSSGLWVATFGTGELYHLTGSGPREQVRKLPKGSLDGLAQLGTRLFISSWEASAIYERKGSEFTELISDLPAPSDIGIDDKRRRLLIPLFYDNTVILYPL